MIFYTDVFGVSMAAVSALITAVLLVMTFWARPDWSQSAKTKEVVETPEKKKYP